MFTIWLQPCHYTLVFISLYHFYQIGKQALDFIEMTTTCHHLEQECWVGRKGNQWKAEEK